MTLTQAFAYAFRDFWQKPVMRIFVKSSLLLLVMLIIAFFPIYFGLDWVFGYLEQAVFGKVDFLQSLAKIISVFLVLAFGILTFRVLAMFSVQFFAEDIVTVIEEKHYPDHVHHAQSLSVVQSVMQAARAVGRMVMVNLLILPVYVLLLLSGVGTALLFLLVNGYLLGRELEIMVCGRYHRDGKSAPAHGANLPQYMPKFQRTLLGVATQVFLLIPFVNLAVPVFAAIAAVHMAHLPVQKNRA